MKSDRTLRDISDEILDMTNGGLDIIREFFPNADTRKNFSIRTDDKNPSASLFRKEGDNRWRLNDFGGDTRSQDCFGVWSQQNNCDYWEAIVAIAQKLQDEKGVQLLNNKTKIYKPDYAEWKIK